MSEAVRGEGVWSEELQATHLALSEADLKFRDFARQNPDLLRRSMFPMLDPSNDPRISAPQQPWPTLVGRAKLEEVKRLSLAVAALIRSLPQRIFHNDPAKICDFYGLPSPAAVVMTLSEPNGIEESLGRGDLIETADGFKCIEFNFGANLGGWETSFLAELHRGVPETARFIEREGVRCSYTSTLRRLFQHVIRQAERRRLCERRELNVACVMGPSDLGILGIQQASALFQRELDQTCQSAGVGLHGRVFACHCGQLVPTQDKLFCGQMQVHVVLELQPGFVPAVYRCFKAGKLLLFNGPIDNVLNDKRNLALLSENQDSGTFSAQERELIRRHIPWTRRVSAARVEFQGEKVFLPDLLARERDRLVLKEARTFGGKGVFLGRFTAEAPWEEAARTALETGQWVVQERLDSLPYLYQCGEYGCAPHDVIWGPFVFGDTYAGVFLRMQPKATGGAVNLSLAATQGIVFEV